MVLFSADGDQGIVYSISSAGTHPEHNLSPVANGDGFQRGESIQRFKTLFAAIA